MSRAIITLMCTPNLFALATGGWRRTEQISYQHSRSRQFPSEAKVEISLDAFWRAVHHLIRIASRWRSSDSSAPSLRPGHNTSGLMRRWHGEPLIFGPPVLCVCQISDGHRPVVSDERYGVGTFGFNASLFIQKHLAAFQSPS